MTTAHIEQDVPGPSRYLAEELRAELGRKGVSYSELARRLGTSIPWVQTRINLTATVDITLDQAEEMAEALGADAESLIVRALRARRDSNPKPSDLSMIWTPTLITGGKRQDDPDTGSSGSLTLVWSAA